MIGDKIVIEKFHTRIAQKIVSTIINKIKKNPKYSISIGGESGSGKTGLAYELKRILKNNGIRAGILQQDDYFIFPSRTCHRMRLKNIEQVSTYEARLDFMEANIYSFKQGAKKIYKPLSIYPQNKLTTEFMKVEKLDAIIAEGTHCALMRFIDTKIFNKLQNHDFRAGVFKNFVLYNE